jgi:hypothetical protein
MNRKNVFKAVEKYTHDKIIKTPKSDLSSIPNMDELYENAIEGSHALHREINNFFSVRGTKIREINPQALVYPLIQLDWLVWGFNNCYNNYNDSDREKFLGVWPDLNIAFDRISEEYHMYGLVSRRAEEAIKLIQLLKESHDSVFNYFQMATKPNLRETGSICCDRCSGIIMIS